jgi:pimeloyl-ACP methyl ester carboxylesterase
MLVGHSYGGLVIGGVAEKVPERIRRLVYLDAYIPQDNKSAFDIILGLETIYKERALEEQGGSGWLHRIHQNSSASQILMTLNG